MDIDDPARPFACEPGRENPHEAGHTDEFHAMFLKDAIQHCEAVRDFASRDLFAEILRAEEEHVDFIETQQTMIKQMGLANYIQLQSRPAGE